jgi:hypothetical protein
MITPIRFYNLGENPHSKAVLDRPIEDMLTGSGYLADGTDFAGFDRTGVFNVRTFGATGNGTTDDTVAIQAAYTAAAAATNPGTYGINSPAAGATSVFFPSGHYRVSDSIKITNSVASVGEGSPNTSAGARISQYTQGKHLFELQASASGASYTFDNLKLDHRVVGLTSGTALVYKAAAYGVNSIYFRNTWFNTPEHYALNLEGGDDVQVIGCTFDTAAESSMLLGSSGAACSNVRVIGCTFFAIPTRIILAVNVTGLVFQGNCIYGQTSPAIRTQYFIDAQNGAPVALSRMVITGNEFYNVDQLLVTQFGDFVFSGNIVRDTRSSTIQFTAAGTLKGVVIVGNHISGNFASAAAINASTTQLIDAEIVGNAFRGDDGVASSPLAINLAGAPTGHIVNSYTGFTKAVQAADLSAIGIIPTDTINVKSYGAVGNGVTDDTAALTAAFAVVGAVAYLPAGTYLTGNLPQPACAAIVGAGQAVSIIQAKAGATKILSLGGVCTVHQHYTVTGNSTASAYGIVFGDAESGAYYVTNVAVKLFTGAGAVGVWWKNALKSKITKLTVQRCSTNVVCDGTGGLGAFPTTLTFDSLVCIDAGLSGSGGVGLKIVTADTLVFNEPAFDSNQAEAVKVIPAASGTVTGVVFKNPRFEANQVGGSSTFQMVVDGSAAGCTARVALLNPQWFSSTAKSLQITGAGCAGYLVDQPFTPAVAGSITVASGAYGLINLPPTVAETVVSDTTGYAAGYGRGKVRFPATLSPSTDPNTLDDYAEGTFSPTLILGAGSVTYTTQTGTYTKVGRLVTVQLRIVVNVATTPSSTLQIGALPYPASATAKGAVSVWGSVLAASATATMVGQVDAGLSTIRLYRPNGTGSMVDPGADIASGCQINLTATYEV